MQLTTRLKRIVFMVILMALALSAAFTFYFVQRSNLFQRQIQSNSASIMRGAIDPPRQEQSAVGLPVRLKIPEINVDAVIESVGLTSGGIMDMIKRQDNVAWFKLGRRPGEIGSAVVAGHYGWENEKTSVFDNLHELREGDKVYVEDDKGATIVFVVRANRNYDPKADASDVFSSNDGKVHLNLVTCEGIWDQASESYSKRLVIFTDQE